MSGKIATFAVLALLLAACSGTPAATPTPGAGPTSPPAGQPTNPPGNATPPAGTPGQPGSNFEAIARALVPPGSQDTYFTSFPGGYALTVTTSQSVEQVGQFLTQAIPAAGLTETGRFTMAGVLTVAFTNPDGGVVASSAEGGPTTVVISVGSGS